jgi:peroxiredoxin
LPHKSAPEVELPDITGKMRKLSEMAISHDINLLVFYSHDCEHCQKLMLNLVDLYKTKHHQSFGVFAVDINSDEKDWKKFLTENRVPFTSTILTNESKIKLRKDYAILAVPTMILIDRNMEIISLFPSIEIVQKYLD